MNTLGDGPVQQEYQVLMKEVAKMVDEMFNGITRPKRTGFILMVFPFDHDGRCNYMSNAERSDVVIMLKEQIARFEGQPEIRGNA